MKKLLLVSVLMLMMISESKSQAALYLENYSYYNGQFFTLINIYGRYPINEKLSVVGFALVANVWGENLVGINYRVNDWLWLEFKAGVETFDPWWRVSPMFLIRKNRVKYFFAYEYGGSGWWFTSRFEYNLDKVKFSMRANKNIGGGPRMDFKIPNSNIYVWGGYTWEFNTPKSGPLFGLYTTLTPKKKPTHVIPTVTPLEKNLIVEQSQKKQDILENIEITEEQTEKIKKETPTNPIEITKTTNFKKEVKIASTVDTVQERVIVKKQKYYVVIASFTNSENASTYLAKMQEQGLEVNGAYSKKRGYYYVVSGKYASYQEAQNRIDYLVKNNFPKGWILVRD